MSSPHGDLVLRNVGGLKLLVCPRRDYGDNIFALNDSSALIFGYWASGISGRAVVTELQSRYHLPADCELHVERCMNTFNQLAAGEETRLSSLPAASDLAHLGAGSSFWDDRVPAYGGIEPTWRCNLNCCHCYIRDPGKQELPITAWKSILDQLIEAGCLHLAITGGEPLRYPQFTELYRYAVLSGLLVTVFTNGTLITDEIADLFQELPPKRIEISLYGAGKSTYDKVVGVPGSYEKLLRGLTLLSDRRDRLDVILKAVVLKDNVHEKDEMRSFAAEWGYPLAQISLIRPRLDGVVRPERHRMAPEDVALTELEVESAREAWSSYLSRGTPISSPSSIVDCSAGNVAFQVDASGRLGYCVIARVPGIDLLSIPMKDAWKRMGDLRDEYFQKPRQCQACAISAYCDFCPGYNLLDSGESESRVVDDRAYHCSVARARQSVVNGSTERTERSNAC